MPDDPRVAVLPDAKALRKERGAAAWRSGAMAEESVAQAYEERGCVIARRRWRSPWGEVDLIARDGATVIVVEVKKARRLDDAAHRLSRRQMDRLCAAAGAFCEGEPKGALTEMRFDLALVDAMGRVRVIENAWGEDW
jgi:putative endonuclease